MSCLNDKWLKINLMTFIRDMYRYITKKVYESNQQYPSIKKSCQTQYKGLLEWRPHYSLEYHNAEKSFVKTNRESHGYIAVRDCFRCKQKCFDKELKRAKRSFEWTKVFNLEITNTENPTEFWHTISQMGPKKKSKIPWEVLLNDGSVSIDKNVVLDKWRT